MRLIDRIPKGTEIGMTKFEERLSQLHEDVAFAEWLVLNEKDAVKELEQIARRAKRLALVSKRLKGETTD
jgi:uncharacterized coiled-coil protein SlyX